MCKDIPKYDFIDALRGYAILGVLLVHSYLRVAPTSRILKILMADGGRGVQLFFIASALTLCMSWHHRSAQEKYPLCNFFIRRFFRIAPLFYISIVIWIVLGFSEKCFAPNGVKWWFVPLTALFLHGFNPETINSVVPGDWSIAVEMNFYLILPFLLRRLTTIRQAIYFCLFAVAVGYITTAGFEYFFYRLYPPDQHYLVDLFNYANFFNQLPIFSFGILAYFLFKNFDALKRLVVYADITLIILTVVSLLVVPLNNLLKGSNFLVFGILFSLFALNIARFPVRLFVNKPIQMIGKISFSMYLSHFVVLNLFARVGFLALFGQGDVFSILYFLCVFIVTVPMSYILYVTIERRGILLGKRVIQNLEQGVSPVAPGAAGRFFQTLQSCGLFISRRVFSRRDLIALGTEQKIETDLEHRA